MPAAREQLYRFGKLDIHSAIIMQKTIDTRKSDITLADSEAMKKGDKVFKAIIEELDQIYDDLDRHIAASVRVQEFEQIAKDHEKNNH